MMGVFAVVHIIHFIFLATSIYLNAIPIVFTRLAGGILAYLMIVIYPFYIDKNSTPLETQWFFYTLAM